MSSSSPSQDELVQRANAVVADNPLPHPASQFLLAFLQNGLDQKEAARYLLQNCPSGGDTKKALTALASDWKYIVECMTTSASLPPPPNATVLASIAKRDAARCCITGKAATAKDQLIVSPILPVPDGWADLESSNSRIKDMLGAFLTPQYRDWWLQFVANSRTLNPFHTHWLVLTSAAAVFKQGLVKLNRQLPSMIEYKVQNVQIADSGPLEVDGLYPLLGDHSRSALPKVDARLLGTHARLASSFRWLVVEEQIAANEMPGADLPAGEPVLPETALKARPSRSLLGRFGLALWLWVPGRLRVAVYNMLRRIGLRRYGPTSSDCVQRLPFGLHLKYLGDPEQCRNEFKALQIARDCTTIPAPEPLDLVLLQNSSEEAFHPYDAYLLTTSVPGKPLLSCEELLSDKDLSAVNAQLQDCVSQLRAIPNEQDPEYPICNSLGGPCQDNRILAGAQVGPFRTEQEFSQLLRFPDDPARSGHRSLFTHGDLNFSNLLVSLVALPDGTRGWRLTGIVDWEFAGFYPEYWEYTKALFDGSRYATRSREMIHAVFEDLGDYDDEFDVEKRSWENGDGV